MSMIPAMKVPLTRPLLCIMNSVGKIEITVSPTISYAELLGALHASLKYMFQESSR